jgi:integrase
MTERGKVSGPYRLESGAWQIRWRDPNAPSGKNQRKESYPSQGEARRQKKLKEADLLRGTYIDMANKTTVTEYMWQWVAARPLRPRTQEQYESFIRRHLEPTPLGARPLVKVRASEIRAWITSRAKPDGTLSPSSLDVAVGVLRSVFAAAVLDGLIASNPVQPKKLLRLPQDDRPKFTPLTVEQVQALAAAMPERYQAMVIVQAGLGLRLGELLGLRIQNVDFLKREVRIEEQLAFQTVTRTPTLKTKHSYRKIPLPQVVADALAEHIRRFPPAEDGGIWTRGPAAPQEGRPPLELKQGCSIEGCRRKHNGHGLCKLHLGRWRRRGTTDESPPGLRSGRVYHQRYMEQLKMAAQKAGLPAGTTSHSLRHHYASVLLHQGESAHVVAERLGHANAMLVNTTYGHVMPDSEEGTRRAIDTAWAEASQAEDAAG